jgi:hypothetical protein
VTFSVALDRPTLIAPWKSAFALGSVWIGSVLAAIAATGATTHASAATPATNAEMRFIVKFLLVVPTARQCARTGGPDGLNPG